MITNITLEGDRFRVFADIDGNQENKIFPPEVTAQDIRDWVEERKIFYAELEEKRDNLINELI